MSAASTSTSSSSTQHQQVSIASSTNARKVSRLLEINPDEEFLQGLRFLSRHHDDAGGDNQKQQTMSIQSAATTSAASSSNAKFVLEQNMLSAYEDLLETLGETDRRFLAVADSVDQLQKEGERARDTLSQCSSSCGSLLAKVDGLVAELSEIQQREQRISSFIRSFQISDQEGLILKKGEVSHDFLEALAKLQQIHDSCKKYTSSSSNHATNEDGSQTSPEQQQAAVEVMESTFLLHMSSLEKVSSYIVTAAPEICGGDLSALDHATLFVEAVRALQSNPGLWAKAVHEIARVRRSAILRRLATQSAQIIREANARYQQDQKRRAAAATAANNNTNGEKSHHQQQQNIPLRILGDLCAWFDECSVDERESAAAFFSSSSSSSSSSGANNNNNKNNSNNDSQQQQQLSVVSAHFTLQDYLDSVFDATARQLKSRAVEIVQELVDSVWPRKYGSIMHALASASASSSSSASGGGAGGTSGTSSSADSSSSVNVGGSSSADVIVALLEDGSRVQNLVALFKTESLLGFYSDRVSEVFGKSSAVISCLNDVKLESMRCFFELLQGVSGALRLACDGALLHVDHILSSSSTTDVISGTSSSSSSIEDAELSAHPSVASACGVLRSLLEVIEQSTIPQAQRGVESAPLLTALLDPISSSLEKQLASVLKKISAATKNETNDNENDSTNATNSSSSSSSSSSLLVTNLLAISVYSINTLCIALSSILPFEFASQKQQHLTTFLEESITRYISNSITKTQERLELDVAFKLVSQKPRPSKESAALAMKVFFAGIFSGEGICPLPVPFLEEIQPIRVRERCRREICDAVCSVYDQIYEIVAADIETDEAARKMILHHTPEQLKLLLE